MLSGDAGELRRELRDLGPAGALVLVAVMLVHAVVPFPVGAQSTPPPASSTGSGSRCRSRSFGWLLSALATYAIGRTAARPVLQRFVGEERLEEGGAAGRAGRQ